MIGVKMYREVSGGLDGGNGGFPDYICRFRVSASILLAKVALPLKRITCWT